MMSKTIFFILEKNVFQKLKYSLGKKRKSFANLTRKSNFFYQPLTPMLFNRILAQGCCRTSNTSSWTTGTLYKMNVLMS